ncbi:MAG: hypothetical protein LC130_16870 [Bryobacterales bacterium]|nr:hypothetical protein [Bryobacterales bacterium]
MFAVFGGQSVPFVRDGRIRAFGPFKHPILAGTVGAVCLPTMIALRPMYRGSATLGGLSAVSFLASGSSGPVLSALAGLLALALWPVRTWMRVIRWASVVVYVILELTMKVPAYYLIARMDVTGSSTGWHRARLIESSFNHLNEWWFAGTDFTRHWMPTGVTWSVDHTDITNHYLKLGVLGGLPLMLLFIITLATAFRYAGRGSIGAAIASHNHRFMLWGLGAALFAHAATCISVSYFDQSLLFLDMNLAAIAATYMSKPMYRRR